jgi:glucose-1-phosphate thymidylyltransferase
MTIKKTIKVIIPMAGLGTRLRPHTWSKPKQLVSVAGKTVLSHVLASLSTLPDSFEVELVNIVGYLGEQIESYMNTRHPTLKSQYVLQENPLGQSHAIKLAEEYLDGPMLVIFADTLIKTDLSFLEHEDLDGVAWVHQVNDPRRFGVAIVNSEGLVTRLIEKPDSIENNLAVVGFYYFRDSRALLSAIDEQMQVNLQLKGEFYLVDAINIMLKHGLKMRTEEVDVWLDAGTSEALIETNRYLLDHGHDNGDEVNSGNDTVLVPPVYIHPTADIKRSIIGPYVSIGANCQVVESIIRDSILEDEAGTHGVILEDSLVGRRAQLSRRAGRINAGDNTIVTL